MNVIKLRFEQDSAIRQELEGRECMSLESYRERMDDILRREVEEGGAPGVSALVLHKGREIYFGAFGMAFGIA